ncbi:MAG TPA: Crp/Fnr family transcriptional regulator [Thiobacillaceae bacterium]|nr:Crp/Fnr family transcriptional regulator [Thiobacillaceae bacterium]
MEINPDQLRQQSALFAAMDTADLHAVMALARNEAHPARHVIFREGEEGDRLLLLLEGRVKVSLSSAEGKEAILSILEPGQLIGEMSLLDGGARSATVTTMDVCRFLAIRRRDFLVFLERHPRVALALLQALSLRLRATNDQVGNLSFLNLPARLARILLNLGQQYGKHTGEGIVIGLKLSQEELGNLVGVSRESVNRQVRLWVEAGLLDYAHGILIIKDSDTLFREALAA